MIQIKNLSKGYGTRVLFSELTFQFPDGEKIALFGANGAGKSTLLNILCGIETKDGGEIICPQQTRIGYLPQVPNKNPEPTILEECLTGAKEIHRLQLEMNRLEAEFAENKPSTFEQYEQVSSSFRLLGGYKVAAEGSRILKGLGFSEDIFENKPESLSGGWRMRLELAKIFLDNPDFLILDEPTNHLDLPSLVWVEGFLKQYEGTVLLVSHDKKLLNAVPTTIVHLSAGVIQSYKGNFDQFLVEREIRLAEMMQAKSQLAKRRQHMEQFVERFGAKASKASQAQSRVKMIAKIKDLETEINIPENDRSVHFRLPEVKETGRIAYTIKDGAFGYAKPLVEGLNVEMEKSQRVAVVGANGVGKTTLMKTMAAQHPALSGEFEPGYNCQVGYFAQDQGKSLDQKDSVLGAVMGHSDMGQLDARSLLGAFLFSGTDVEKTVKVLSGGEKSRLGMAQLLSQKPNFLILDEPTNHLDMSSVEALLLALGDFKGSMVFVSHDRYFVDELCTHVLVLYNSGEHLLYEGKLSDYESYAAKRGLPHIFEEEPEKKKKSKSSSKDHRKEQREAEKSKRAVEKIEKKLAAIDAKIQTAQDLMLSASPTDLKGLADMQSTVDTLNAEKSELENKWLSLTEDSD
ncbi:ABC-F family ATP-binding cassette domain-containing protein [Oligoflexaceae bacterium]|nr:ABC-F family ATP-binding cassette domain-containing protein [Oligoflexaceae bacterium]